ncbi:hypothetical protein TNIN_302231, partial [Trichonephila inaurata madagascariensis]
MLHSFKLRSDEGFTPKVGIHRNGRTSNPNDLLHLIYD